MTTSHKSHIVRTMELSGKNALVTGAAKRLGREIAVSLADRGVNIAIHYHRSKKEAEDLAKAISDKGFKAGTVRANIGSAKSVTKAVQKAADILGGLDILINNAAVFYQTPVEEVSEKDWDKFIDVNLKAQFYFAREFVRFIGKKPAKIINMADTYGASPAAQFIPYGVSKAGVIALTKGLAKAYAPDVLVNCICPGPVMPPEGFDERAQKKAVANTLLKRMGKADDITKTVLFLIENDYITGQAIFVDGGRNI